MALKFGKVDNNNDISSVKSSSSIKMGIENAPTKLIVKYITDMYARPLTAAIRETVSNALDAVTAAGKNANEIDVSYDSTSRVFSVRDAGAGMDYDKLVNVYTQYGVSDKRDDGTSTGAFGLGAKSPLAYTNEFFVVTKTDKDGCLFLRAYRTIDDNFIADLPVLVPDGGSVKLTVHRDVETGRSVALSDDAAEFDFDVYSEELVVENPFAAGETGTVVSFATDGGWTTQLDVENTIEMMAALLHYTGAGDIIDPVDSNGNAAFTEQDDFFCFGERSIADADGDEAVMRVFACHTLSSGCSWYRLRSFSNVFCGKEIEPSDVMFKVGNWLYPSDGTMFSPASSVPAYIIDVPSKALPFVPSRDAILTGKSDNVSELIALANDVVSEFVSAAGAREQFINWATSLSGSFSYSVDALMSSSVCVQKDLVDGRLSVSYGKSSPDDMYELDPSALTALGGFTLRDLMDTPYCVTGLIDAPKADLRNAGVYAVSDCDASKICSSSVQVVDENMERLYSLPGYSLAKSKTIADDVYGMTGDMAFHSEDIEYAVSHVNHSAYKKCNASAHPTLAYPVGLAMMNLARRGGTSSALASHVMFIDGSVRGVKKVRASSINIAKNLQAQMSETPDAVAPASFLYVILPPKSMDENWTKKEKTEIESLVSSLAAASGRGYVHVPDEDIARLSKKPESAKIESSELEKMVSNARFIGHVMEVDDDGAVVEDKLEGSMYMRTDKHALAKTMLESPSSWGIVVVDQKKATVEQAWSLAEAFYAFDLIPEYIENVVCILDKNFSKKRSEMCIESGFMVLYDQAGKSGEGYILSDTASFSERGKVELHVPPTKTASAVYAKRRCEEQNARFLEIINNGLSGSSWKVDGKEVYNTKWVEGFTLGREKVNVAYDAEKLVDVPKWKIQGIEKISIDEDYKSAQEKAEAKEFASVCLRLQQCVGIWKYCLSAMALSLDLNQVSDKVIANLPQLAAISGVESCVESLYAGVPYDDIVA